MKHFFAASTKRTSGLPSGTQPGVRLIDRTVRSDSGPRELSQFAEWLTSFVCKLLSEIDASWDSEEVVREHYAERQRQSN